MPLPPDLSKIAKDTYTAAMKGKARYCEQSGKHFVYSEDHFRALYASVEAVLREVHARQASLAAVARKVLDGARLYGRFVQ
jgi:ribosomal protein RSM22 (predicted rRNA methylase)